MIKLIRQIRSLGSQLKALVSMLPARQKPEDAFKAPTYKSGGSDSSCTRQGGIKIMPVAMVSVLLEEKLKENRMINMMKSVSKDFFIDFYYKFSFKIKVFSPPKVFFRP